MSIVRSFSVVLKDPKDVERVIHGDVRESGNTRFRGAEEQNRWVFHSVKPDGTFDRVIGPVRPVSCVASTVWSRQGADFSARDGDPLVGDKLYAISKQGNRYYVGEVVSVLDLANVEVNDIGGPPFGNEPIGGYLPLFA